MMRILIDNVSVRHDVNVPNTSILGVNFAVDVIKISQEDHLQEMICEALIHERSQFVDFGQHYKLVNKKDSYVDLEQYCDECPPIQVLSVKGHEVIFVLILILFSLFKPSHRAPD